MVALSGCGTSGDREQAERATLRFYAAVAARDRPAACAELSSSIRPCPSVAGLDLHGGRVVRARVYITNALVELSGGDKVFLGREPGGWKIDAAGCNFAEGKPADRPASCEVED